MSSSALIGLSLWCVCVCVCSSAPSFIFIDRMSSCGSASLVREASLKGKFGEMLLFALLLDERIDSTPISVG